MKKNGKKYRKIQKEKELKRQITITNDIDQEVDGIKTANLSTSHIVTANPVIYDIEDTKKEYLNRLSKYLKIGGWNKRKYESSEMEAYKKIIMGSSDVKTNNSIGFYKYYILFDLIHILGYEIEKISTTKIEGVKKQYLIDFGDADSNIFKKIINSVQGEDRRLVNLIKNEELAKEKNYIELVRKNVLFRKQQPFGIMVTATMSAGKSTFINSLIGKYICLSQNMACTSKIHSIINKSFEDGYASEYDHDLVMTAGREELLNDNELNTSNRIYVSTHYNGGLNGGRYIVNDSPGVNFSGDSEHKEIADRLIKGKKYNLLIYVMNSTQLATNDEDEHLDFVKRNIGRTPIIFIMNKVDSYDVEEENIIETIHRQTEYLTKKGFKNPIVCPVSARAGYLAKQFSSGTLTRSEERELYNYVDKFEQMRLVEYYKKSFPAIEIDDSEQEETQLLKNCGLSYVEEIIKGYAKGGK
ncbi:MAG: hypothetical protein E7215_13460 [Clostridium sulfidigenes]|uniref:Dynamin N-terminal domain-containing protein n=1 Tax=Clostridium sulfidigenes TaxID=318464 RepID=A0A927WCA7_9CLOT|nr:hypothetical protein [Clostridium sulfidigenes]